MSGGGGIIIIRGKNADGSYGDPQHFPVSAIQNLWEAVPESARTSPTWNQVEAIITSVT